MNWIKSNEGLPRENEEVLLHYHSLITFALFDGKRGKFISKISKVEYDKSENLSWSPLAPVSSGKEK
jgi:hypothetical protein